MKSFYSLLFFLLLAELGTAEEIDAGSKSARWLYVSAEYQAIVRQTYVLAADLIDDMAGDHEPGSWAVTLDADETVISNASYEWKLASQNLESTQERWNAWVKSQEAVPMPGVIKSQTADL